MVTMVVEFFITKRGRSPVKKDFDKFSSQQRTKVLRQLQYLQEFGMSSAVPNLKKVKSTSLWESRILGKNNIRIFCVVHKRKVVVLHIFEKKKQKTPERELSVAVKRFKELDK